MRKIWSVIFALGLLLTGIAGCDKVVPGTTSQPGGELTPPALAESDFNFIFKYGVTGRTTLDTFRGTYTKDMVNDPDITINLTLTRAEMDSIYQKMAEIDFFKYPDVFEVVVPQGESATIKTPYSTYYFSVEKDSHVKEFIWRDKIMNPDARADKLRELIKLITSIIESKDEYKKLPQANGGYI